MLRKILALVAVGVFALFASMAGAYFIWHAPAETGEAKHRAASGTPTSHETAEAPEHATHEAAAAEASLPAHGESGGHAAAGESPAPSTSAATEKSTPRSGPAFEVAQAALSSLSPQEGLQQVEAALAMPHNAEQGALLREAQGELYAQLDPPDYVQSQAAFEQALELSADTLLEEEIRYKAVQMLMQAGNDTEALKVATAQFVVSLPTGVPGFKLKLLQGQLLERAGDTDQAEKSYRSVLDAVAVSHGQMGREDADSLARLAALRLTQSFRSHGREKEIEDVTALLKKLLAQMQEPSN